MDDLNPNEIDFGRMERFRQLIAELPNKRVLAPQLWEVFEKAFPHRPRGIEPRLWLLQSLQYAEASGTIRIPPSHGRRWDTSLDPSLPFSVDRIEAPKPPKNQWWKFYSWHPKLIWVRELNQLDTEQGNFLKRVQEELLKGTFKELVSLMHRSLHLTGDEKRLKNLSKTVLFGEGRLSLELLGCILETHPLVWESINAKSTVLVLENPSAFTVTRNVLKKLKNSPYGIVAYGAGKAFEQSIRQLLDIGRPITQIDYVGDLDPPGVAIPYAASVEGVRVGLPVVQPARGFHQAMLEAAKRLKAPNGFPYPKAEVEAKPTYDELVAWLPEEVRQAVTAMFKAKRRIPEEILAKNELLEIWKDEL